MPKVIAGSLGNCVHVAGVVGFLAIAERVGYETEFLGAAVPVGDFVEAIREHTPDLVGVSFRLTPEVAEGSRHTPDNLHQSLRSGHSVSGEVPDTLTGPELLSIQCE